MNTTPKRSSLLRQESSYIWLGGYFLLNEKENNSQITVSVMTYPFNDSKRIEYILHKKLNNIYICETRIYKNNNYSSHFSDFDLSHFYYKNSNMNIKF